MDDSPITSGDIRNWTQRDPVLSRVQRYVLTGWPESDETTRVRNLGVIMDQHLSMIDNVSAVCASCNYYLRRLSSIRRYLTQDATRCAVQAFITSRLDYCNSLLHDIIPLAQIERLQRIQNKAARLITRTRQRDHITPVLRALYWLPVCHRI